MPKKPSLASLKKKVWVKFSLMRRLQYTDSNGMCRCISCGKVQHYKEMHAGHYIPKSMGVRIYFEERDVHPQCAYCNVYRHGNLAPYAVWLETHYGQGILQELDKIAKMPPMSGSETRQFLEEILESTKQTLSKMSLEDKDLKITLA